jgi:hypothetical protein
MGNRPKRIKTPEPALASVVAPARVVADAIDRITEAIREAFGPRQEIKIVHDEFPAGLVVEMTPEEASDPNAVRRAIEEQHGVRIELEGDALAAHTQMIKRNIRDRVAVLCGYVDGAEVTADGSADNDLALERADAVMAFLDLARGHMLPRKLLPRGDRLGDWLPPGTPVVVHLGGFEHPAVVEPTRDMVTVRLAKAGVVTEYPRALISKEGEPWTPPKHTE